MYRIKKDYYDIWYEKGKWNCKRDLEFYLGMRIFMIKIMYLIVHRRLLSGTWLRLWFWGRAHCSEEPNTYSRNVSAKISEWKNIWSIIVSLGRELIFFRSEIRNLWFSIRTKNLLIYLAEWSSNEGHWLIFPQSPLPSDITINSY